MVGEKIKLLRERKGITINELALMANISKSYISSIERGLQKNPSINVLEKIALALDVSLDMIILEESEDMSVTEDWLHLLKEAIEHGLTKEEFIHFTTLMEIKRRNLPAK
ncbi:helix-turn-helix transcriptional regulator [Rossellomorea vietnamensis]|uniref:Helix-turn-helix transcriptional regulator n=1 Tax=Rossellomorea vietnamensis TaxID=218284 RepID=A0A5D4M7U6_9BACI|nr:helix-turn-helix transcriptional regulator [Rossellomorea vietnamensis]TYR97722.1 helix-turn-helix transcriptional regulator [Rossellomorea vietnamensis]